MESLVSMLPELLRAFPENEDVRRAVVFATFKRIAGDGLRDLAKPVELVGKKLIVEVPDKIWCAQMEDLSRQLLFDLNRSIGEKTVTFIEFSVSDAEPASKMELETGNAEIEVPEEIVFKAAGIEDPELRRRFLAASTAYLNAAAKRER
ncbi:MAG: DciA family protein [Pyrinomonadaceae bacterium]